MPISMAHGNDCYLKRGKVVLTFVTQTNRSKLIASDFLNRPYYSDIATDKM